MFEICCRIIKASPLLKDEANILADTIRFPAFNAIIKALPTNAGPQQGLTQSVAGFDKLWAIDNESGRSSG